MQDKEQRKICIIELIVEEFVYEKSGVTINISCPIYSIGLLDSLEMLELVMELESYNLKLDFEDKNVGNKLDKLDTIEDMIKHIK